MTTLWGSRLWWYLSPMMLERSRPKTPKVTVTALLKRYVVQSGSGCPARQSRTPNQRPRLRRRQGAALLRLTMKRCRTKARLARSLTDEGIEMPQCGTCRFNELRHYLLAGKPTESRGCSHHIVSFPHVTNCPSYQREPGSD